MPPRIGILLAVGAGGAIGTVARWGVFETGVRLGWSPAVFLLVVNVLGSFGLGWVLASPWARTLPQERVTFLTSGVLGSFTTFSGFTVDSVEAIRNGAFLAPIVFIAVSLAAGTAAVVAGRTLAGRS